MIQLLVDGKNVDLYGDETINIDVSLKSARNADRSTASFTNSFQVPATENNNLVFSFYFDPNRVVTEDYRYRVPAAIEIDTVPFKRGFVVLSDAIYKMEKVVSYQLNFTSFDVTLLSLFGDFNIKNLDWTYYDYDPAISPNNTTRDGMRGDYTFGDDNVIFPLIQSYYDDAKWTPTTLSNGSISQQVLKPAFRMREILDMVDTEIGANITSSILTREPFTKLYVYCPYVYDPENQEAVTELNYGFSTWNPEPGFTDSLINLATNVFDVQEARNEAGYHTSIRFNLNYGPNSTFTFREYTSPDGVNYSYSRFFTFSNEGPGPFQATFEYASDYLDNNGNEANYARYQVYSTQEGLSVGGNYEVWGDDNNQNPTYYILQGDGNNTSVLFSDPIEDFSIRVPSLKVKDIYKGLINMYNLMIWSYDGQEYFIEDYDTWKAQGEVKDLSDNIDITQSNRKTPLIPRDINFHYHESEAIVNEGFFNLNGKRFGDLERLLETPGDELQYPVEAFSCPLWENIGDDGANGDLLLFSAYTDAYETIDDEAFIMYWGGVSSCNIDFSGWSAPITSYKVCSTFFPFDVPTESLAFDNEQSSWDNNVPPVGLFTSFYENWFNIALSIKTRKFVYTAYNLNITENEFQLYDTVQIGDQKYLIDNYKADLVNNKVELTLFNIPQNVTYPPPSLPDRTPPNMGVLSIDCGGEGLAIPTGIILTELLTIEWDNCITYTEVTNSEVRAYLKNDVILPFTGDDATQYELKVNGSPVVFQDFGIHYAPGQSYVTLRNPVDFLPTDVIEFSYTAGADPIEGENTGTFAPNLVDQLVENTITL